MPTTSFFRMVTEGGVVRRTSSTKPVLNDDNKRARVEHCKMFINLERHIFNDMYDVVHIDEKWFYITKAQRQYYLTINEELPQQNVRNKRYITKVMFLCAVAHLHWDTHCNQYIDGKIGIWPFTTEEEAKRSSRNRPAGTKYTKAMDSVGKEEYHEFLTQKVVPAIKEKWPECHKHMHIRIQ